MGGEGGDVFDGGGKDQFFRRGDLHDRAVLHDGDAVGQADRFVEVVGDEDDGLLQLPLDAQEFLLHLAADQGVKRAEGFIQEPQVRLDGKAAGNADALLLPARKLARDSSLAP